MAQAEAHVPSFTLPFGTTPLPPELQQRKGRYWNYEKNRWSFCSDDEEGEEKEKKSEKMKEKKAEPTIKNVEDKTTIVKSPFVIGEEAAQIIKLDEIPVLPPFGLSRYQEMFISSICQLM